MNQRLWTPLRHRAARLPDPEDYLRGLRRHPGPAPDNILAFARRRARALWPGPGHDSLHHRWVLIAALQGSGTLRVDRRPARITPGKLWLIPPLHLHGFEEVRDPLCWVFITFDWPGHSPVGHGAREHSRIDASAAKALDQLLQEIGRPDANGSICAARLHGLLLRHRESPADPPAESASLIARVRTHVQDNAGRGLRDLARRMGMSESHLRARFRAEAGLSLGRYLRESRLRWAALGLKDQGWSVKEAAARAGYPDPFSFSRAFKRAMGFPPSQLR